MRCQIVLQNMLLMCPLKVCNSIGSQFGHKSGVSPSGCHVPSIPLQRTKGMLGGKRHTRVFQSARETASDFNTHAGLHLGTQEFNSDACGFSTDMQFWRLRVFKCSLVKRSCAPDDSEVVPGVFRACKGHVDVAPPSALTTNQVCCSALTLDAVEFTSTEL